MKGVTLQQLNSLVSKTLHVERKVTLSPPEIGRGVVLHNSAE